MGTISISSILIAFLSALGIGLVVGGGHAAAPEPTDTHAADLAGIEKLRRSDIDATLTQDPAALNTLWSDDGVNLQVPGGPVVGIKALKEFYEKFRVEHPFLHAYPVQNAVLISKCGGLRTLVRLWYCFKLFPRHLLV